MTTKNIILEGQGPVGHEDAISCSLNNDTEAREGSQSNMDHSEIRLDLEKIISKLPVPLDAKPPKVRRRYRQIQRTFPFSSEFNFSEESISGSQDVFYGGQSLLDFPADTMASGYFFRSSTKHSRTSRSMNNMSDFLVEYSHDAQYPSLRWMYSSIEEMVKRMDLIEFSLPLDPFKQHFSTIPLGSRLTSMIEMKSSDLSIDRGLAEPLSKQGSKEKLLGKLVVPLTSTRSTSSYLFMPTTHTFGTSALIYCVWEGDAPYFLFIVDDDGAEIYAASPLKAVSFTGKPLDYIYLIHSWKANRKVPKKNITHAPLLVGKMTVSSSLIVDLDRSRFMETEFILFGANEEHSAEKEKLPTNLKRSDWQPRKLTELFRPIRVLKHNSKCSDSESDCRSQELQRVCMNESRPLDESGWEAHPVNDFSSKFELAATVIRDYGYNCSKGTALGGWGLKFLEKAEQSDADLPQELRSSSYENFGRRSRSCRKKNSKNVTVLVPAGTHGGPVNRARGPSSIIERWRSAGHCDCGGWDVGCPLKVLSNDAIGSKDLEEDCQSLELLMEGGKPSVKMLKVRKDMYAVNFESSLSSLQAFSIAVAFIHAQAPDLLPKL